MSTEKQIGPQIGPNITFIEAMIENTIAFVVHRSMLFSEKFLNKKVIGISLVIFGALAINFGVCALNCVIPAFPYLNLMILGNNYPFYLLIIGSTTFTAGFFTLVVRKKELEADEKNSAELSNLSVKNYCLRIKNDELRSTIAELQGQLDQIKKAD